VNDAPQGSESTPGAGHLAQEHLSKRELLRQAPVFETFPDRLLTILARRCDTVAVAAGTVVIAEGVPVPGFYVLAGGSLAFTEREEEVSAASLSGTTIGLGSMFSNRPSSLTVTTRDDSWLLAFREREFWQIAVGSPELLRAVVGALTRLLMAGHTDALST
jgi:CRP-like cAMP-binding protein